MRVALCVKRDIYGLLAARAFLTALNLPDVDIAIFCSVKTRPAEEASPWLSLLKALEHEIPFEVLGEATARAGRPEAGDVLQRPWQALRDLRSDGGGAQLLAWKPDLVVSMRFSLIFPRSIIAAVPRGIINLHPGALPGYRGLFAPFWQAVAGEPEFLSTVHLVDAGIDTGPILREHRVLRDEQRSLMWHMGELYRGGARIAAEVARERLGRGAPPPAALQPASGRYWSFPSDAEILDFVRGPMRLFSPAEYRALLTEALRPVPSALATVAEAG